MEGTLDIVTSQLTSLLETRRRDIVEAKERLASLITADATREELEAFTTEAPSHVEDANADLTAVSRVTQLLADLRGVLEEYRDFNMNMPAAIAQQRYDMRKKRAAEEIAKVEAEVARLKAEILLIETKQRDELKSFLQSRGTLLFAISTQETDKMLLLLNRHVPQLEAWTNQIAGAFVFDSGLSGTKGDALLNAVENKPCLCYVFFGKACTAVGAFVTAAVTKPDLFVADENHFLFVLNADQCQRWAMNPVNGLREHAVRVYSKSYQQLIQFGEYFRYSVNGLPLNFDARGLGELESRLRVERDLSITAPNIAHFYPGASLDRNLQQCKRLVVVQFHPL